MAHLLHIDSSPRPGGVSVSREMSSSYVRQWREARPGSTVLHRDLAAEPFTPVDADYAGTVHAARPEGVRGSVLREAEQVIGEFEAADIVVIGCPMHNLTVPVTLKNWIDRLLVARTLGRTVEPRPIVVLTARGGGYGPGTPMEPLDFQEPYLRGVLSLIGLDGGLTFIHTELTMADTDPALAAYAPYAQQSRQSAEAAITAHTAV